MGGGARVGYAERMARCSHPIVKIFGDSGCQAYLVACPETKKALLVDPKAGKTKVYEKALADFGLELEAVADTHTHADHLSGSIDFLRRGLPVYMSKMTGCRRAIRRVAADDEIQIGRLRLRVLELPGHTPDSIGLWGGGLVLAGDTLFVGSLARADFRGADPAELFTSISERLLTLPGETVVLPGHGYADVLFTTIAHERRSNPALRHRDAAAYAAAVNATPGAGNTPQVDETLALNEAAEPTLQVESAAVAACCSAGSAEAFAGMSRPREQSPQELASGRAAITARGDWIDVRDRFEYETAHIPGAVNLPLGELGFHLDELRGRRGLVFSCAGGVRSMSAAKTLAYLGVIEDPVSMTGGFKAWQESGEKVETGRAG
jgi:glyoxylase-like metal-dependent hydrolase (beta-lactamase superfamily II)/rhodanese-related sulfurtransferase